jgi:hypothetical protein
MTSTTLGIVGEPAGVSFGADDREIWAGIRSYAGGEPSLLRVVEGDVERVPLPAKAGAQCDVNGVARTIAGELLVMIGVRARESPARPWLRRSDGTWRELASPLPLVGWVSQFALLPHGAKVYVPTQRGVLSYDGKALRRESSFQAISLWSCSDDTIVARGFKGGQAAHQIARGDGRWTPFAVPAPDVVAGGKGKSVYLTGRNALPVRRVRIATLAGGACERRGRLRGDHRCPRGKQAARAGRRHEAGARPGARVAHQGAEHRGGLAPDAGARGARGPRPRRSLRFDPGLPPALRHPAR